MQSKINTIALNGIETIPVDVQVHLSNGMPTMAIVGLADKAVAESKERVRAALTSLGMAMPAKRIAINPNKIVRQQLFKILKTVAQWRRRLSLI